LVLTFYYRFRAVDATGKKVNGSISSESRKEALYILEKRGLYPVILKQNRLTVIPGSELFSKIFKLLGFREYRFRDLMLFCRQFSTLLQAGVPVLRALLILSVLLDNQVFRRKLQAAAFALERGTSLAEALDSQSGYFPPLLISMIEAGESSGMLDEVMERVADHYEKQHDLEEKIRSATAYPIFITAIAFIVMAVMIIFVLPQFSNIFNQMGMEMPFFTGFMLSLGENISIYWPYLVIFIFVSFTGLMLLAQTKRGRHGIDKLRPRLPLYGPIYRQNTTARFARTLGTLLANGISMHQALRLTDKVIGNTAISESINELSLALSRGESLAGPLLTSKYFPTLLGEMVRIGEETGNLEYTLKKTADYYEKEVSYIVERLSSILEPVLLLIVGSFIGILVFSILSPMYQVFQLI